MRLVADSITIGACMPGHCLGYFESCVLISRKTEREDPLYTSSEKIRFPQLHIKCGIAKSCPGTHRALQAPMSIHMCPIPFGLIPFRLTKGEPIPFGLTFVHLSLITLAIINMNSGIKKFLPGSFSYVALNRLHLGVHYIHSMIVWCSLLFEIIPFSGDSSRTGPFCLSPVASLLHCPSSN